MAARPEQLRPIMINNSQSNMYVYLTSHVKSHDGETPNEVATRASGLLGRVYSLHEIDRRCRQPPKAFVALRIIGKANDHSCVGCIRDIDTK